MPLSSKGQEILKSMEKTYGSEEKAKQVLYASKNAGKITGIDAVMDAITSCADAITAVAHRFDAYVARCDDRRVIGGVGHRFDAEEKTWRITGTSQGKSKTVTVQAKDHNEAVRKGSHHPHMLVVNSAVLVDK